VKVFFTGALGRAKQIQAKLDQFLEVAVSWQMKPEAAARACAGA
jgi:hypothetical protein